MKAFAALVIYILRFFCVSILKICYGSEESKQDYISVDILIKMIIIATRERALNNDLNEVVVYNCAAGDHAELTNRQLVNFGRNLVWDAPASGLFWYPSFMITNHSYIYYVLFLLYHMVPALITDGILKLVGRQPMLIRIQRKIFIANVALVYFMRKTWTFVNDKAIALSSKLMDCDKNNYSFSYALGLGKEDVYGLYLKGKIGSMKYLFKEEYNFHLGYRNTFIMWILDRLLHFTVYGAVCWYLVVKMNIVDVLCNKFNDILLYWNNL